METLFNFLHIRPPVEPREDITSISLASESAFQEKLREAAGSDAPRDKLKAQARKFVASKGFIGKPEGLRYQRELRQLAQRFDDHQQRDTVDPDDLTAAVQDVFGKSPAERSEERRVGKECRCLLW